MKEPVRLEESEGGQFEIKVDIGALQATLLTRLKGTVENATLALQGLTRVVRGPLGIPGSSFQLELRTPDDQDFEVVKERAWNWILGCGLRDALEHVNALLIEVNRACAVADLRTRCEGEVTVADWEQARDRAEKKFPRFLPHRLDYLRETFGDEVMPGLESVIRQINDARRCLVHGDGIVGDKECDEDGAFHLSRLRLRITLGEEDGSERDVTPSSDPATLGRMDLRRDEVVPGSKFKRAWELTEQVFQRGERLEISEQAFAEICWTIREFGMQLSNRVRDLLAASGLTSSTADDGDVAGTSED